MIDAYLWAGPNLGEPQKDTMKYRIIPDSTAGYNVQSKRWWGWRTRCWAVTEGDAQVKLDVLKKADAA